MRLREIIVEDMAGPMFISERVDDEPIAGHIWLTCPHCILAGVPDADRTKIRLPFRKGEGSSSPVTWGWNGETDLEKVTFTPSIRILDGHWHGHIQNGEVTQPNNTH